MISVCLATYNGGLFIKEQLVSILSQLSEKDEIIISDDGSSDETMDIIHSFNDDRIKVLKNGRNKEGRSGHQSVSSNFENALKNTKGDFIFLADQDDIWKENKVKICLDHLYYYDLVLTNAEIIDRNGISMKQLLFLQNPLNNNVLTLLYRMPFYGCCLCFRKSLLTKALPFPKNLELHDNWLGLMAIIFKRNRVMYIDSPLILYRRHSNNVSGKSKNNLIFKVHYRVILLLHIVIRKFGFISKFK
ncbi:MAG: glycosyltransferase family 2 protein [Sphingobacterium sp.]|jgi:glycosyltransferase involved in cell wall biosynthesis|nr:glycosyltransferase family 2 protein [Sphingobacterium sp.]